MSSSSVIVTDVAKAHDNPFAELVQEACKFESNITLESNNRRINAKSIMGVLAFSPCDGMEVEITAEGTDEQEALRAMENFLVCA